MHEGAKNRKSMPNTPWIAFRVKEDIESLLDMGALFSPLIVDTCIYGKKKKQKNFIWKFAAFFSGHTVVLHTDDWDDMSTVISFAISILAIFYGSELKWRAFFCVFSMEISW